MTLRSGDENMGRKKTAPPSKSVRIHEDVYDSAMIVAGYEHQDMTQFLSELLRPIIKELHLKHAEKTVKDSKAKPTEAK